MTDKLAIVTFLAFAAFFALDYFMFDGATTMMLARKLYEFILYLKFWR